MALVTKSFSDIITFTRASTATYFNSAGVLQSAGNNVPRFDYNPATLAARGLLIEESRTNSIRNNTMQGAVAGTPGTAPTNWVISGLGTLTQQVVGVGTVAGINYIDLRFSGTTSSPQLGIRFEPANGVAGTNGQTFTFSAWVARVAGSTSNIGDISANANVYDSGSVFLSTVSFTGYPVTAPTTLSRASGTGTIASASAAFIQPQIYINFASGVAIDITLRIGLPQLEQGAFATSVIPTTTTALTRSADVASVNTLSPWWNASEGTFYVEGSAGSLANSPIFVMPHDGTSNNYLNSPLLTTAGLARLAGVVGGAAWTNVTTANSTTANTTFKSAAAFKAGDQAICLNAGTVATGVNASLPVVTTVKLGDWRTSGNSINGYLRRITYYPRRLSNAELQAITTP